MKYTYALIAILAALAIGALGYFGNDYISKSNKDNGFESAAYLPPEKKVDQATLNLNELRSVLDNFQSVKSFRSTIVVDQDGVVTRGEVSITKPDRFHGKMNVEGEEVEVIGVDDVLYIKSPDEVWIPVRSEELSAQLNSTFAQAIQDPDNTKPLLDGEFEIYKKRDSDKNCNQYETKIEDDAGNVTELTVCEDKGYPVYIIAKRGDSLVRAEYSDYNALFTIERPSIPKMFWPDIET